MRDITPISSSCLCGNIKIKIITMDEQFGACHCGMCRKWGGGPLLAVGCSQGVEIEGDSLAVYDSSEWAERGFCSNCGTHLFYRIKETGEHQIPVGLLGDSIPAVFGLQVFIDRKPEYYSFSNNTQVLTEKQIFDMYAPEEGEDR